MEVTEDTRAEKAKPISEMTRASLASVMADARLVQSRFLGFRKLLQTPLVAWLLLVTGFDLGLRGVDWKDS